jgi:Tol biopolymer transport system component
MTAEASEGAMFLRSMTGNGAIIGLTWALLIWGAMALGRSAPSLQYVALSRGGGWLTDVWRGEFVTLLDRLERAPVNTHWSPDGAYLGMVMQQGNRYDYWTYQPSTGDTTVVLRGLLRPALPAWTNDSRAIAYQDAELNVCTLDVADFATGTPACLSMRANLPPAWSRDGSRLALVDLTPVAEATQQIIITERDGRVIAQIQVAALAINDLAWSPDDSRIAFSGRTADGDPWFVHLLDLPTRDVRPLVAEVGYVFELAWSPDSERLAFVTNHDQGFVSLQGDIYMIDAGHADSPSPPRQITDDQFDEMYLSWADEAHLRFMTQEYGYTRAALVNVAGPSPRLIAQALAPASYTLWRP